MQSPTGGPEDGLTDGRTDGWTGRTDGRVDGQTGGRTDGQTDGLGRADGRMDGWADGDSETPYVWVCSLADTIRMEPLGSTGPTLGMMFLVAWRISKWQNIFQNLAALVKSQTVLKV